LTAVTFQITDEDHTLGNALRYVITKKYGELKYILICSPDVEFCGYSIPHPSEPKLNMRIQTYGRILPLLITYQKETLGKQPLMLWRKV